MLSNEIKSLINDMAEEVRKMYSITVPITDIDQVVRNMGGKIIRDWFADEYSDEKVRKTNNSFVIEISAKQSNTRANFNIIKKSL